MWLRAAQNPAAETLRYAVLIAACAVAQIVSFKVTVVTCDWISVLNVSPEDLAIMPMHFKQVQDLSGLAPTRERVLKEAGLV